MMTAYKFRLYPNKQQISTLKLTLDICRHLYNDALAAKIEAWKDDRIDLSEFEMSKQVSRNRKHNATLKSVYAQVEQNVLKRLKRSFDNYFRRCKEHATKKGFPRFKSVNRYNSFTYPQSGFKIKGSKLTLSKIGSIKIKVHRQIEGKIKTCTIKRNALDQWFAIFVTEQADIPKIPIETAIGIDLGLEHAVTTSNGDFTDYPGYYRNEEEKLKKAHKNLSRKKLGSSNRNKARIHLAKAYHKVTNIRDEFLHQTSRILINSADAIIFEDLSISGMIQNRSFAKSIQDVSWGKLIAFTQSKAERAGKSVILVDPRNTSQICSSCETIVKKDLSVRIHECPACGLILHRDHNAALNIRTRGMREIACGDLANTFDVNLKQVELMKQETIESLVRW